MQINIDNRKRYHLIACHEPLLYYMHKVYADYIQRSTNNIISITNKFITRISNAMTKLPSPFFVKTASKHIFETIKNNFPISQLTEKDHGEWFGKDTNYEFEIEFGSKEESSDQE